MTYIGYGHQNNVFNTPYIAKQRGLSLEVACNVRLYPKIGRTSV